MTKIMSIREVVHMNVSMIMSDGSDSKVSGEKMWIGLVSGTSSLPLAAAGAEQEVDTRWFRVREKSQLNGTCL